jgi:hypothetical protein
LPKQGNVNGSCTFAPSAPCTPRSGVATMSFGLL